MPEIRVPLYGMVFLSDLEWAVIGSSPFQRLRRIKQLAFSDYVYPGAGHSRFEHSLGVMHLATRAFDSIWSKPAAAARMRASSLEYDDGLQDLARRVVRLAALTHDLGHLPFSHAAEEDVFPSSSSGGNRLNHEDYSVAITRHYLQETLSSHKENRASGLTADEVASFLSGRTDTPRLAALAPWRGLISGELDADRMDYLRRDSHHLGIQYGSFDVDRVLSTLTMLEDPESGAIRLGIEEGGLLAIESLILARYYMFHQVCFHKVRRYLDKQCALVFKEVLGGNTLPLPNSASDLESYLSYDDWRMFGEIDRLSKAGFAPAMSVKNRQCNKVVYAIDDPAEELALDKAGEILKTNEIACWIDDRAIKETQKFAKSNILVEGESTFRGVANLITKSKVATSIPDTIFVKRVYVSKADRDKIVASKLLDSV